jgi:hypothetical protein
MNSNLDSHRESHMEKSNGLNKFTFHGKAGSSDNVNYHFYLLEFYAVFPKWKFYQ